MYGRLKNRTTQTLRNMLVAVQATLNKNKNIPFLGGREYVREGGLVEEPWNILEGHHYTLDWGQVHIPPLEKGKPSSQLPHKGKCVWPPSSCHLNHLPLQAFPWQGTTAKSRKTSLGRHPVATIRVVRACFKVRSWEFGVTWFHTSKNRSLKISLQLVYGNFHWLKISTSKSDLGFGQKKTKAFDIQSFQRPHIKW